MQQGSPESKHDLTHYFPPSWCHFTQTGQGNVYYEIMIMEIKYIIVMMNNSTNISINDISTNDISINDINLSTHITEHKNTTIYCVRNQDHVLGKAQKYHDILR
jgi:hypothetical protein